MTRDDAVELLLKHTQNVNLQRHCYGVEAVMRALAKRFKEDEDTWGIAGLLHDADYEELKGTEKVKTDHTKLTIEWLHKLQAETDITDAIAAHAWGYVDGAPEPKNRMQWSLYCCDELTGLIVAVALVKPDKRLSSVTIDSVMKKWNEKGFAAGANREQIRQCEGRLKIPLREFVEIALIAMQQIAPKLGL
jgi:putative nucleotidyltransferase with HDIG domain